MPELRYLKHKNIDPVKWDQCISKSLSENIYGYHWYLNAVADYQWDAIVMDDYNAVFPLPVRKKFGLPYIYQPFFCQWGWLNRNTGSETSPANLRDSVDFWGGLSSHPSSS